MSINSFVKEVFNTYNIWTNRRTDRVYSCKKLCFRWV